MINFNCPNCGQKIRTNDANAAKQVRCPKCGQPMQVPQPPPQPPNGIPDIIKFRCPGCNQKIGLDKSFAGKTVRCAKCKTPIQIPSASPQIPERPLDIDLLLSPKPPKTPPVDKGDYNEMLGGELLKEALSSPKANAPSADEPLKLSSDAPREQPASQKRCPRCSEMNPPDAFVCSVCAFELAASQAGRRRGSAGTKRPLLAGGIIVLSLVLLGILVWTFFSTFKQMEPKVGPRASDAESIAQSCVDLLKTGNSAGVKNLLVPQLQDSVTTDQLDDMAKFVNKAKITDVNLGETHYQPDPEGDRYYLSYDIRYEDFSYRSLILSARETNNEFKIDGLAANDFSGATLAIGPRNYNDLSQVFMEEIIGFGQAIAKSCCAVVVVGIALLVIQTVCLWVIFDKAGHPGWAAIVPFYNMWVLAEISGMPGWLGLVYLLVNGVPYVGPIAGITILIIFGIGIAKSFNRGVLFGLGLALLPIIFYPILAFATD